jgi:tetratricopeptide (TPR) repeat protein
MLGIIANKSNHKDVALDYFTEGYKSSTKNFLSFKGALDLLIEKKDFASAYELNQRILQIFPFNPEFMPVIITLAIATKRYEEILELNNLFKELKHISPKNKKYLAAGLMMGAQFLISQKKINEAKQSIQTAVALSPKSRTILIKACILLAEQKFKNEALAILTGFTGDNLSKEEFIALQIEINHLCGDHAAVIKAYSEIMHQPMKESRYYQMIIEAAVVTKLSEKKMEDAKKYFPEWASQFSAPK